MADGASWSQGWSLGENAVQRGTMRKQQLADEERQQKATDLINTRNAVLTKLPTLLGPNGEKTPEYDQAYQALTQAQQGLGQLYHPDKAPGALQQDWHWLLGKMHGITAPKDKTPTSITTQSPAMTIPSATGSITSPELPAYQQVTPRMPSQGGPVTTTQPGVAAQTAPGMPTIPKGATPTMAVANPKGLVEAGNIPIWNRPSVLNDDGTHSSELSISMQDDKGNEVLIPLIADGKFLTPNGKMPAGTIPQNAQEWDKASPEWKALKMRAWQNYEKTGQHLGKFDNADDTDAYAQVLHNRGSSGVTLPAGQPVTVTKAPAPPPVPWAVGQVQKLKDAARQKAQGEASLLAAGAPLSPTQQAMSDFQAQDTVAGAKIDATLKRARDLGLPEDQISELKQQLLGMKNITFKPLTGAAGAPTLGPDGLYYQAGSDANGNVVTRPMPPGWKPTTKAIRGTLINTKEHGYIQTWVNPYTLQVMGWQKVTPGRQYTGTTSSSSSTDPFGLTTSTSRTTMPANTAPVDFDFSGKQELPDNFTGEETPNSPVAAGQTSTSSVAAPSGSPNKSPSPSGAPPKSVSKPVQSPTQLRSQVSAPPSAIPGKTLPLDSTGHIPANAPYNALLIGAANDLLDGKDQDKLDIPAKAKEAASNLARQYGWGGQGMFNPQQKLQIREASTFLNDAVKSDALSVLDSTPSRLKLIAAINNSEGHAGFIDAATAKLLNLNPKEAEFLRMYRQLTGTISGLASLTRPGRPTEAGIKRLMFELPNPNESHSATDAKERLKRLIKEIDIATKKGNADDLFNPASSSGDNGDGGAYDQFLKKHNLSDPSVTK